MSECALDYQVFCGVARGIVVESYTIQMGLDFWDGETTETKGRTDIQTDVRAAGRSKEVGNVWR